MIPFIVPNIAVLFRQKKENKQFVSGHKVAELIMTAFKKSFEWGSDFSECNTFFEVEEPIKVGDNNYYLVATVIVIAHISGSGHLDETDGTRDYQTVLDSAEITQCEIHDENDNKVNNIDLAINTAELLVRNQIKKML